MKTFRLPAGHVWKEQNLGSSTVAFACDCGATWIQDLIDNSVEYDEGEGHDED